MIRSSSSRAALCLMGFGILLSLAALLSPAQAAVPHLIPRPRAFVAYARVALVRLTVQYYAQSSSGTLTPLELCTGLGTIVATTGQGTGGNARSFVLTDSHVVSLDQPCAGAIAAYKNANKTAPVDWKLSSVTAYLDSDYTGTAANQVGATSFALDTSALPTLGRTDGPVVLPLAASHAPSYDLPVVPVPATQPDGTSQVLDLGSTDGVAYAQDTLTPNLLPNTLATVETNAAQPPILPTPTPVSTGTAATPTPSGTATPISISLTPAPPPPISLGAPLVVDSGNGSAVLGGIVVMTPKGLAVAGVDAITKALRAAFAVSNLGTFAQRWMGGLSAYYAASQTNPSDPNYAAAAADFEYLQQHYPAFGAASLWLNAALAGSPQLGATPAPAGAATPAPVTSGGQHDIIPGLPIHSTTGLIALGAALFVLLVGLAFWARALALGRRTRRGRYADAPSHNGSAPDADITAKAPAIKNGQVERRADPRELPPGWKSTVSRPTLPLPQARVAQRLGLQAVGITDPGVRRREAPNQDAILAVQGARLHDNAPQAFGLFIVADGMGGHQFGREASTEAIRVMAEHILQPLLGGEPLDDEAMLDLLKSGVEHANGTLHYRNTRQHSDMGTTVTAALVAGDMAFIVNVGDSRTYHLQPHLPLRQITADHSVVASLVAAGIIQPDDIYTHPKRSQIYRSLGEQEDVQVDTFNVVLQPGDQLLLCSDGLWEMVRDPRLEELLRTHRDLHTLSQALVAEANANGGVDNISAIVVRVLGEEATPRQIGMRTLAGPPGM